MSKDKIIDFNQAEKNARMRDLERSKVLTEEEMEMANDLQAKANSRGMKLIPERKMKNRFLFAQFMQKNWEILRDREYFSSEEKIFLMDMQSNVSLHSNAIVDDITKKPPQALSNQAIADILGTSRTKISRIVNSLIRKGILAKSVSGDVTNTKQAKDYVLFVNPHVIFAGDKDKVEEHLILQFQNQMKKKVLKDLPDRFF
ncbi:MarR family transcriptional regulator [Bacillus cereus]|uniref:MarR family transcriptional regulator n=1 Tax=Bacillus cereus TaxID=1396 RepID=UPI000BF6C417|nr:MarR family transcriptional regulator [Bacillus cereus]PFO78871.1 MarR family transcriptional regulator [Bacillus cereus]